LEASVCKQSVWVEWLNAGIGETFQDLPFVTLNAQKVKFAFSRQICFRIPDNDEGKLLAAVYCLARLFSTKLLVPPATWYRVHSRDDSLNVLRVSFYIKKTRQIQWI
jgi:hypothetical protein